MSKLKFDFDKRQMPQIIGLGALTLGLIGYFSWRLLVPAAPSGVASAAAQVGTRSLVHAGLTATGGAASALTPDDPMAALTAGTAPAPGMRDPFTPLVTDHDGGSESAPVKTASALTAPGQVTSVPGLPPLNASVRPLPGLGNNPATGSLSPLPAAIPSPTWIVTGVLAGSDPSSGIAVLRQGDVRRFVRLGAMVDEQYRLVGVDRFGVTLGVGNTHFRVLLGGDGSKAAGHVPVANGMASGFLNGSAPTAVPGATPAATTSASAPPLPPASPVFSTGTPPSAPSDDAKKDAQPGFDIL